MVGVQHFFYLAKKIEYGYDTRLQTGIITAK
jgi:hypothetical protein